MDKKFSFSFINFMKGVLLLPAFLFILVLGACSSQEAPREIELKPYKLAELAKQDFSKVDKIAIKSGETGEEKTFEDKEQVQDFIKNIEAVTFTPDINQERRAGWTYMITFYEGRKKAFEFYPNYIDDIYFKQDDSVVAIVEELFNSK
ncbi:MAG TPA: hypothetical protein GX497_17445 [Bacillus bacterium]|nr:hypothetical protein [Bacillus sp. (in: firmicutes)]